MSNIVSPKKIIKNTLSYEAVAVQTDFSEATEINGQKTKKSPLKVHSNTQTAYCENGAENLSRVEMLKLLDDAQINTPLDSQSAEKIRQINGLSPKNSNYTNSSHRQRQVVALETLLFGDSGCF